MWGQPPRLSVERSSTPLAARLLERRNGVRDLRYMGITAGSFFPGLDGACEELKDRNFEVRAITTVRATSLFGLSIANRCSTLAPGYTFLKKRTVLRCP